MKKLIFATNNQHKLEEIKEILNGKFEIMSLDEVGFNEDIQETGTSFAENAAIKSRVVTRQIGMDCFSDDTGLQVEALGGRPGVYSARYAGEEGNAAKNVKKLLIELKDVSNRKAAFKTAICLIMGRNEYFFEGSITGRIIDSPKGEEGFGYDPVFVPDGYDKTFAEMPASLKNRISHRRRAVEKLVLFLNKE